MKLASATRRWAGLGLLLVAAIAGNLWWLYEYRRGLPFSIDESGYLQRAVLYSQLLRNHGLDGFVRQWTTPDIVGPILPATTGLLRSIVNIGPLQMLGTQQIYYALTILATYLLARQFTTRSWALAPTIVVACTPGIIDAGRTYYLAEPATAFFTILLLLQLRAGNFSSLNRSLIWGVALGVAMLTRTIMVAFIAAPSLAAVTRLIASGPTKRSVCNLAAGTLTAFVVAGSWYAWSWHTVLKYLTGYGYGTEAGSYGHPHPITSPLWWIARLNNLVNQDLYAPITIALVLCSAVALVHIKAQHDINVLKKDNDLRSMVRKVFTRDGTTVLLSVAGTYFVLSTSHNGGSYFELPLIPPFVVLALVPLARVRPLLGFTTLACVLLASGLAATDQFGVLPVPNAANNVDIGEIHMASFTQSGVNFLGQHLKEAKLSGVWWTNCGGASITCFYGRSQGITTDYLKPWYPLSKNVSRFLYQYSAAHARQPVVFFAAQGPLFNTNTVALAAQLTGHTLPIGALVRPSKRQRASFKEQLENPIYGQPNFVITERTLGSHPSAGSSMVLINKVANTLLLDGFKPVAHFKIPDDWEMLVWWKNR